MHISEKCHQGMLTCWCFNWAILRRDSTFPWTRTPFNFDNDVNDLYRIYRNDSMMATFNPKRANLMLQHAWTYILTLQWACCKWRYQWIRFFSRERSTWRSVVKCFHFEISYSGFCVPTIVKRQKVFFYVWPFDEVLSTAELYDVMKHCIFKT